MAYIDRVQPPLKFIPPAFNPWVLKAVQSFLPLWLKGCSNLNDIQLQCPDRLVQQYHQFYQGKTRLLIAFRHPSVDDPLVLFYLLAHLLPQAAYAQGIPLPKPIHCHFLYDRGIPLWAGRWVGWLYAQLGGVPIQRGKLDMVGLKTARQLLVEGNLPFAAAPEGATNGHNEIVSPIEPGVAQLGFWAMEDLKKADREMDVVILPLGLRYQYLTPPWEAIDRILTHLETDSGIAPLNLESANSALLDLDSNPTLANLKPHEQLRYARLYRLGQYLLHSMEDYYRRFYHKSFTPTPSESAPTPLSNLPNATETTGERQPEENQFSQRLQALLDTALQVAEEFFGIQPKGSVIDRCRRLEQAGWDRIYRDDLGDLKSLSPLEKGLADRIAEEASLRLWHMRLVENFVAVTGQYVRQKPTGERFAETSLLMWDLMAHLKDNNPGQRPRLGPQQVTITVGDPLHISTYWSQYQQNRRAARQAISALTTDLQHALEHLV